MESPIKTYKEDRPWGHEDVFTRNQKSSVKILTVNPGEAFSLQTHKNRDEFWRVISGEGEVTIGEEKVKVESGREYFIPRGTAHRIEAGSEEVVALEISLGEFDEGDIIRLEDKYGRI